MSFDLCIYVVRDVIAMNWFNPTPIPGSQPLDVVLDIELSPDAKITHVSVAKSTFDSTFRKFKLHFNPAAD